MERHTVHAFKLLVKYACPEFKGFLGFLRVFKGSRRQFPQKLEYVANSFHSSDTCAEAAVSQTFGKQLSGQEFLAQQLLQVLCLDSRCRPSKLEQKITFHTFSSRAARLASTAYNHSQRIRAFCTWLRGDKSLLRSRFLQRRSL